MTYAVKDLILPECYYDGVGGNFPVISANAAEALTAELENKIIHKNSIISQAADALKLALSLPMPVVEFTARVKRVLEILEEESKL